jgi:hypothetical protein
VKRIVGQLRGVRGRPKAEPDVTADPTPIRISKRIRTALILAVLALLGLVIWFVPSVLTTVVGGFALALALSFPVRWLSWLMPRGLAILVSFLRRPVARSAARPLRLLPRTPHDGGSGWGPGGVLSARREVASEIARCG